MGVKNLVNIKLKEAVRHELYFAEIDTFEFYI